MENELTNEVMDFLSCKWMEWKCPMCKTGKWIISTRIFELREFARREFFGDAGNISPVIPVTCDNCGMVIMINALVAGIVKREVEEQEEEAALRTGPFLMNLEERRRGR